MTVYVSGMDAGQTHTYDVNTIIIMHYVVTSGLFVLLSGSSIYMMYHKASHKPIKLLSDENLNLKSKSINKVMSRFETKAGFPEDKNPVMIKDYRMMAGKRWSYIPYIGLMLFAFFIAGITFYTITENPANNLHDDSLFWLIFIPLIILPYAGNCFRMEKDQDTYDLLLSTNIPVAKIVQGKFMAGLTVFLMRYAVCFVIFTAATFLFFAIDSNFPKDQSMGYVREYNTIFSITQNIFIAGILPLIIAIFFLSAGMFFSATMKHTNAAFAFTFITAFFLYFGIMITLAMIQSFLSQNFYNDFFRHAHIMLSPIWFMGSMIYDGGQQFRMFSAISCFQIQAFMMIYASIIFYYLTIKKLSSKAV
jgi:hypothetical protein